MRSSSEMYKAEDPNRDGVIYLGGDTEVTPGSINPFDFRVRSIEQAKEVKLRVGGILGGKRPAALVNGRTLTKGDRIEGFNVVLVGREGVVVEKNGVFVRLPRGRETLVKEGKAP